MITWPCCLWAYDKATHHSGGNVEEAAHFMIAWKQRKQEEARVPESSLRTCSFLTR